MDSVTALIEDYARREMSAAVAHDFKHVDRVRRRALSIAAAEAYPDLTIVEATALLHDIGLAHTEQRRLHGEVGAQIAAAFLQEHKLFSAETIAAIAYAIRCHNSSTPNGDPLVQILRDADILDALGAVGIMRCFTSKAHQPDYNPACVKSDTWGLNGREFDARLANGLGIGEYIIDQLNFQISYYDNLSTETAKKLARPLVVSMQEFICQLEAEVSQRR